MVERLRGYYRRDYFARIYFWQCSECEINFCFEKQAAQTPETFVYPLSDLQSRETLTDFIGKFQNGKLII